MSGQVTDADLQELFEALSQDEYELLRSPEDELPFPIALDLAYLQPSEWENTRTLFGGSAQKLWPFHFPKDQYRYECAQLFPWRRIQVVVIDWENKHLDDLLLSAVDRDA